MLEFLAHCSISIVFTGFIFFRLFFFFCFKSLNCPPGVKVLDYCNETVDAEGEYFTANN